MKTCCEQHLRMTPDRASKRLRGGADRRRGSRRSSDYLSDGRLTLGAVVALAPHLKVENSGRVARGGGEQVVRRRSRNGRVAIAARRSMKSECETPAPVNETSPSHAPGHVSGQSQRARGRSRSSRSRRSRRRRAEEARRDLARRPANTKCVSRSRSRERDALRRVGPAEQHRLGPGTRRRSMRRRSSSWKSAC